MNTIELQCLGELNIALLREDLGERRRVIALPLLNNEGLVNIIIDCLYAFIQLFLLKKLCSHVEKSSYHMHFFFFFFFCKWGIYYR